MRDVEALHAARRFLESEIAPEFLDCAKGRFVRKTAARLLVRKEFLRVARRHCHDIALCPALRREEGDLAPAFFLGKPLLDDRTRSVVNRMRQ